MSDSLFEHAPVALLAVDERQRIAAANRAALRLFGPAAAPPAALDRISGDELGQMVGRLLAGGGSSAAMVSEVLDAEGTARPMDIEANRAGPRVVLSFTPANRPDPAKPPIGWLPADLVASAAEELRQPLTDSLGNIEVLSQTPLSPAQLADARLAQDRGRAALARLDALADLARFEAGLVRLDRNSVNPIALVEGAAGMCAGYAHRVGLALDTVIDPAMPTNLLGDPQWLLRALGILLDNALQYTRSGGVLLRAVVEKRSGERWLLGFEVQDSGPGVAEALRPHLFEPLTARSDLPWDRSRGLGISLAFCRHLARAYAGDAYFRPGVPTGSVFGMRCELAQDGAPALTLERRIAAVRNQRVLLIDPSPLRLAAFLEQRQRWGMDARARHDGRDVAPTLRDGWRPNLLLIHQAALSVDALQTLPGVRTIVLVPLGEPAAKPLLPAGYTVEWASAPMSREALLNALAGEAVPALARPEAGEGAAGKSHDLRVLLAEDSEANRAVLIAQLQRLGVASDAVALGADALRLALQRRYDLLLLDVGLPDLAGTAVAQSIRAAGGEVAEVPILAITGSGEPQDRQRALAAGMNDLLVKPLALPALAAAIQKWTGLAPLGATTPAQTEPVLSSSLLAQLEEDVGAELFDDLLRRFANELLARCERMAAAAAENNGKALEREAHALKSAARSYGASAVADAAVAIESYARSNRDAAAAPLVHSLPQLAQAAKQSIERLLAERADRLAKKVAHG